MVNVRTVGVQQQQQQLGTQYAIFQGGPIILVMRVSAWPDGGAWRRAVCAVRCWVAASNVCVLCDSVSAAVGSACSEGVCKGRDTNYPHMLLYNTIDAWLLLCTIILKNILYDYNCILDMGPANSSSNSSSRNSSTTICKCMNGVR